MDGEVTNYLLGGTIENCSASSNVSAICMPESGTTVNMVAYTSHLLTITNCTGGSNTSPENTGGYQGVYKEEGSTIANLSVYQVTFRNNNTNFAVLSVVQGTSLGEAFPAAPVNANFRFVGWYDGNTQVTSSTTITGNMIVTAQWDFLGSGIEGDPYLIPSVDAWNFLADKVNGGNSYSNEFFRQTGDFTITRMVGATINANGGDLNAEQFITFNGTYDGYGHTLTANLNVTGERYVGPFHCISDGATIKNLIVTGTVQVHTSANGDASNRHPAALIGCMRTGTCVIENCRVSANVSGADYVGGIIGHSWHANVTMTGCVYSGTLTANGTNYTGGLIGWGGDGGGKTFVFSNNIFTGSYSGSGKFHPVGVLCTTDNNPRTVTNTYYTAGLKNMTDDDGHSLVKGLPYTGEHAYSITGGTGVTVAAVGTPTPTYNVSGLDFYGTNGFAFNGVRYGAQGDAVSLNLSGAEHYAATTGTLSGTANPYTLTMAAANSEIVLPVASVTTSSNTTSYHATLASAVSAWEANSTLTLLANVETSTTITITNICTLDLNGYGIRKTGSGAVIAINWGGNLTLNDSDPTTEHHFDVNVNNVATLNEASGSLTIYGGYITGGSNDYGGAIDVANSGVDFQNGPSLTMNAGTLIGNSGAVGGVCVSRDTKDYYNTFTMNGGAICYNDNKGVGVYPQGTFHMNGGSVHHNNGNGIDMWNSKLLTLNNAVITDNNGYGIAVDTRRAAIQVQGRTIVSGNNTCDIFYSRTGDGSRALSIVGALHSEARIGISNISNTPNPFTSGLNGHGNASNFFSNNAGYVVGLNTSGEAYLHVPYTVTYNGNGNDGGTVPTDAATYAGGVAVTIPSAVPTKTGYTFTGWLNSVDNNTYAAGDNFTITANTTLTAQWTINNYTITAIANPTADGTVTGAGTYDHFASCTLMAIPATGYHFVNWTEGGVEVSTSATYGFTVTGAGSYVATFAQSHVLTLASSDATMGIVTLNTPPSGVTEYIENNVVVANKYYVIPSTEVAISATPATDYHFVQWNDNNTNATRTVTVNEDATYTATFAIDEYRIDSIRLGWQVKIGNASPIYPTSYVENPTDADTLGYVMIPVGSEFVIIPSEVQKPLVSKLELMQLQSITISNNTETFIVWFILGDTWAKALARQENNGCGLNDNNLQTILSVSIDDVIDPNINYGINNN